MRAKYPQLRTKNEKWTDKISGRHLTYFDENCACACYIMVYINLMFYCYLRL